MAKRKRAYGSTKAAHRKTAGSELRTARDRAQYVRQALAADDCVSALRYIGALNRDVGAAQRELANLRRATPGSMRGGGTLSKIARKLETRFMRKCVR
jgi:hypothetical protein